MKIAVIGGCGHVGLPLSIALANRDFEVTILDINQHAIDMVNSGRMPFIEHGAEELLLNALNSGKLRAVNTPEVISDAEVIISIVGTPVDEHLNPAFGVMMRVLSNYLPYFVDGQTLILRSTVFPGTSEKVHRWLRANGKDVHVAFCPERIAEGYALEELTKLPQIVSSFSSRGLSVSRSIFGSLTEDLIELHPMEAEIAKLFTNAWRYIKFAAANQFYMIANEFGLDFYKIHEAMVYKYPRASDLPKPGFSAGPCLFKDTMQLSAFSGNTFFLGHSAMLINEGLPDYVVRRLRLSYNLPELRVGILGMAFKANIDDKRESLSYKLKKILEVEAKQVLCTDPYVKGDEIQPLEEVISGSDLLIIGAPHRDYQTLNTEGKPVVDVWNILGNGAII